MEKHCRGRNELKEIKNSRAQKYLQKKRVKKEGVNDYLKEKVKTYFNIRSIFILCLHFLIKSHVLDN